KVILSRNLDRRLDRFASAGRKEDLVQRPRGEAGKLFSQCDRGHRRPAKSVDEFEPLVLLGSGLDQLLAAMPYRARFHRPDAVKIRLAVNVRDSDAFTGNENRWSAQFGVAARLGKRHPQVIER